MALTKIGTNGVKDDAVTSGKIADDAVGAEHIEQLDADLSFADDAKAKLGAGDDLQIWHDGTDSKIVNATNDLILQSTGDDVVIKAEDDLLFYVQGGAEAAIVARNNGEVDLRYDGNKKFETTSS